MGHAPSLRVFSVHYHDNLLLNKNSMVKNSLLYSSSFDWGEAFILSNYTQAFLYQKK